MAAVPSILHTVLDATDTRACAEFYRRLLALDYRPGDEPPADGVDDDDDWLVLRDPRTGAGALAFQKVERLAPTTWPDDDVPMQLHLDTTVTTVAELRSATAHALELGGRLLLDRSDDEDEPLYVIADPAGHPLCIFVRKD